MVQKFPFECQNPMGTTLLLILSSLWSSFPGIIQMIFVVIESARQKLSYHSGCEIHDISPRNLLFAEKAETPLLASTIPAEVPQTSCICNLSCFVLTQSNTTRQGVGMME